MAAKFVKAPIEQTIRVKRTLICYVLVCRRTDDAGQTQLDSGYTGFGTQIDMYLAEIDNCFGINHLQNFTLRGIHSEYE
jgi:hypothetical protein